METDKLKVYVLKNDSVKIEMIDNVRTITIKDKKYNLMIMKDYWPLIGEIDGSIYIESDDIYKFENIRGFYKLSKDIFHLIIRSEENDVK